MYKKIGKRAFDIIISFIFLLLFWWLYIIVAFMIRVKLGSPVIFSQKRPGKNKQVFTMYKFRTMTDEQNNDGQLLSDEERLPKFGKILRASSLDEIPELWNVLIGNMSIVGPRPLLVEYLPRYNERQKKRHDVKPGITGWAQVNGRNAISWEQKFEYDVWYVEHQSFGHDIKILWLTFLKVIKRSDIAAEGHVTTTDFMGTPEKKDK